MTSDHNVTASFAIDRHVLTLDVNSSGSVSGGGTYDYGTSVNLTAIPATGYQFSNWTGATVVDATSASTTIILTADTNLVAHFVADVHELILNADSGGSASGDGNYSYGTHATISATPSSGYYFTGWNGTGVVDANSSITTVYMTQDHNLTASFAQVPSNARVVQTFANPVGSGSTDGGGIYAENSSATISSTPGIGYQFLGWSASGGTLASPLSATAASVTLDQNSDANATAHFDALSYGLVLKASTGGSVSGDGNYSLEESVSITAAAEDGYSFIKWEVNGTLDFAVTATARQYDASTNALYLDGKENPPLTLVRGVVCQFVLDGSTTTGHPFYFSADSSGGGNLYLGEFTDGVTNSRSESSTVSITVDENTPSTLYYYCGNHSGMGNRITVIDSIGLVANENTSSTTAETNASYALRATFSLDQYTLTVNAGEGGSASGSGTYDYGALADVNATTNAGYHFGAWSGSGVSNSNSSYSKVSMTSDRTVTANFEIDRHVLTVIAGVGGVAIGSGTYDYETNASISADPDEGYHFVNWTGQEVNDENAFNTNLIMTGDVTVTANFEIDRHILTVTAGTGGSVSGAGSYDYEANASISATPDTGYHFDSWSGAGVSDSSSPSSKVSMISDRNVTANFEINRHILTLNSSPTNAGTLSGAGTYEYGSTAVLNASPVHGHVFSHWSGLQPTDYNSSSLSLSITQDVILTAHFVSHSHSGKLFYELKATELEGGWWESDWFDFFHQVDDNWVYHFDFGWIYVHEVTEGAFWYWHGILGWLWTNGDVYPFSWSEATNHWIRFYQDPATGNLQTDFDGRLWYYDYSAYQWILAKDSQETSSYEVNITRSPSIGGTVSGEGSYQEGSTTTLTALPADGYKFVGWSGDLESKSATLTFSVTQNLTLTATFEKITVGQVLQLLFD
jgi:uncharacterized repeat protein (TIGR02543 family)